MSEERHTEVRGPSFIGLGKRPSLQPCHHALLLMGKISNTWGRRKNTQFVFSSVIHENNYYLKLYNNFKILSISLFVFPPKNNP